MNRLLLYIIIITIVASAVVGCGDNISEKKLSLETTTSNIHYETKEEHHYPYEYESSASNDSIFIKDEDTITISLNYISLNDSVVTSESSDTTNNLITKNVYHTHNGEIKIGISGNNLEAKTITINKLDFAEHVGKKMAQYAENLGLDYNYISIDKQQLIINVFFCFPESGDCYDAIACIDLKKGELIFIKGSGNSRCDSEIQVINDSFILTCEGVLNFDGDEIVSYKDKHVVLAEIINDNSFLTVYDLITVQEHRTSNNGDKYFYEEHDTISNNAISYSTNGEILYSFRFDEFYLPLSYSSCKIRTADNQLILFNFKKNTYFLPMKEQVLENSLLLMDSNIELDSTFNEYKVHGVYGPNAVHVSDSTIYWEKPEDYGVY